MKIKLSPEIKEKCPNLILACIQATVKVEPASNALIAAIKDTTEKLGAQWEVEQISQIPAIQATREAYKKLGKKPGRYRPSAEALLRRVISDKGLYQINNVVDSLNLLSISSAYSIGGYDLDKIQGDVRLGIGQPGEPYQAIARGALNIANLPIFRDDLGAFGSPTSDSVRTMVTENTHHFLMIIFAFSEHEKLDDWTNKGKLYLEKHAGGKDIQNWSVY